MSGGKHDDPVMLINSAFECLLEEVKRYVVAKFGKLSPDVSQFSFINGEKRISFMIDNWLKKQVLCNSDVKNEEFGISSRLRGCASIRQKRYADSIQNFNRSLRYSIYGSENYILAKENRSEAIYNLKDYEDCIEDCDYVLKNLEGNEPDIVARLSEIMLRKMKCYVRLKKFTSAITVYESASGMATGILLHQKDEWESELKTAKNGLAKPMDDTHDDLSNQIPPLLGGENNILPSASSYLTLQSVTSTNRRVITTKDLKAGDVLFAEEPFALMVMRHDSIFNMNEFCSRCCKQVKHIQPCTDCPIDIYCSTFCQLSAWESYHKWECKVGDMFSKLGPASLAFRMTCLNYNKSSDPQHLKRASELYFETESMNPEMYFMYAVLTAMLVRYLLEQTDFIEKVGNNDSMKVAENIFHSLLQVIFNGQLITKSANIGKTGVESLMDQSTFASAVYLSTSMMNHSCDANTYITFLNSYMIVRAARDIKKGREITNSYGVNFRLYTKEERLDRLQQYCFVCKCIKCKEMNKPEFVHQSRGFICKYCNGAVTRKGIGPSLRLQCLKCCRTQFDELAEVIDSTEDLFEYGITMVDKSPKQALNYLQECRLRRLEYYPPTSKALAEVYAAISLCYTYLEQFKERDHYLKLYTDYMEERYGPVSLDLAHNYEKVGDIICQIIKENKQQVSKIKRKEVECAVEFFKRARWVVSVTYGPYEPYKHVDTLLNKKINYAQNILNMMDTQNKVESTNDSPNAPKLSVGSGKKSLHKNDTSAGQLVPPEGGDAGKGEIDPVEGGVAAGRQLTPVVEGVKGEGVLVPAGGNVGAVGLNPVDGGDASRGEMDHVEGGVEAGGQLVPAKEGDKREKRLVPVDGGNVSAVGLDPTQDRDTPAGLLVPAQEKNTGTGQIVTTKDEAIGAGRLVTFEGEGIDGELASIEVIGAEGQQSSHSISEMSDKLAPKENAMGMKQKVPNNNGKKEDTSASTCDFTTEK